jgi:3-hydroxybutyryl-CoA dehydrogenase
MNDIRKVVVVGAGTMGSQIALQTARSGHHSVVLTDADPTQLERAQSQNQALVNRWIEKGRIEPIDGHAILGRVRFISGFEEAVSNADLAIEAVYEDVEVKRDVFKRLDEAVPEHTILASNSSTIVISRLADVTRRPDRCCNMHFFHPVTVMQLCEIVRGPETSDATTEATLAFVRSIDRIPVLIRREIRGFIVNRILVAATEEALRLYEQGYADFKDIDVAVKRGLNWPMGLFELLDFSGIDIYYGTARDRHLAGEGPEPSPTVTERVQAGTLGRKTGKGFYEYDEEGRIIGPEPPER